MKTILVPVDFSDNSKNALDYAILLAQTLDMKLQLLHTKQPAIREMPVADPAAELEIWCQAIIQSSAGVKADSLYVKEKLSDVIEKMAQSETIDLVVMGTKGATGLKGIFLGSNATDVIANVSCPVIAVPEAYRFNGLKKIVFSTDYHDSDVPSIRFMVELARKLNADLAIIHVSNEDRKFRLEEDLLEYFKEQVERSISYDRMSFHLLVGNDLYKEVIDFTGQQKADMLAVSAEERVLSGPLFNQGITKKLATHIEIPLFAFHAYDIGENELF